MRRRTNRATAHKAYNSATVGYEAELWRMADALRGSLDAAEYKQQAEAAKLDAAIAANLKGLGYGG